MRSKKEVNNGLLILTLAILLQPSQVEADSDDKFKKCVNNFCLPGNYTKSVSPFNGREPTEVAIDFEILQILEIDDVRFTISILMYLGGSWVDPRIISLDQVDPAEKIPIDIGFADDLWLPDIYIYDMKEITIPKYYIPFAGEQLE